MFDRTSFVALGMAGAFALGLAVGPQLNANRLGAPAPEAAAKAGPPATVAPEERPAVRTTAPRLERVLPASAPPVQQQVKLLLNPGADVRAAAKGFPNARELMTVAYAARNTDIPFVLLKHKVLNERQPLAVAIRELKPDLDEIAEVNRARAEAKADLARMPS